MTYGLIVLGTLGLVLAWRAAVAMRMAMRENTRAVTGRACSAARPTSWWLGAATPTSPVTMPGEHCLPPPEPVPEHPDLAEARAALDEKLKEIRMAERSAELALLDTIQARYQRVVDYVDAIDNLPTKESEEMIVDVSEAIGRLRVVLERG